MEQVNWSAAYRATVFLVCVVLGMAFLIWTMFIYPIVIMGCFVGGFLFLVWLTVYESEKKKGRG